MKYVKLFEQFIFESGNAIEDSRPFEQSEIPGTLKWIEQNVYPVIGIDGLGEDAAVIGSAGKKREGQTSGDIDIAVSADKIAGHLNTSVAKVLFEMDKAIKESGLQTKLAVGFQQVSIAAPIGGDFKNGVGQVDLMLSRDIKWSKFMYHSPDFTKDESKYKGAYRNILLMAAVGKCFYEVLDKTEDDQVKVYQAHVIRLNQGIVQVRKSFEGKKGLLKNAKLLKEFDKEVTNTPQEVVDLLFKDADVSEIMTYESLKNLIDSNRFKFPNLRKEIYDKCYSRLEECGLPLPDDVT
jgi:hypothetical protein